jgi:ferredoxin
MHVKIDREKCCGAGQCVLAAPAVFDQGLDDGIVILLEENPPEEMREDVVSAADLCPARAIEVEEG